MTFFQTPISASQILPAIHDRAVVEIMAGELASLLANNGASFLQAEIENIVVRTLERLKVLDGAPQPWNYDPAQHRTRIGGRWVDDRDLIDDPLMQLRLKVQTFQLR